MIQSARILDFTALQFDIRFRSSTTSFVDVVEKATMGASFVNLVPLLVSVRDRGTKRSQFCGLHS